MTTQTRQQQPTWEDRLYIVDMTDDNGCDPPLGSPQLWSYGTLHGELVDEDEENRMSGEEFEEWFAKAAEPVIHIGNFTPKAGLDDLNDNNALIELMFDGVFLFDDAFGQVVQPGAITVGQTYEIYALELDE